MKQTEQTKPVTRIDVAVIRTADLATVVGGGSPCHRRAATVLRAEVNRNLK